MAKLLRRFGDDVWSARLLSSFDQERRLFRCLGSSSFLHSRRHMKTTATHPPNEAPSGSPPAPAVLSNPRWVLLSRSFGRSPRGSSPVVADDDKTAASSRCSTGRPFRISMDLVAPPASSFLYHDWTGVSEEENIAGRIARVVAAHGDSILFEMWVPEKRFEHDGAAIDYFIYTAAGGAGRPPSLSPLPVCDITGTFGMANTGVLRRGEGDGDLLVAQLEVLDDDTAELCVHRPGRGWELKREVPIDLAGNEQPRWASAVVPVGSRYLCWVNYVLSTVLVCDMAEEEDQDSPRLRYVPLPVEPLHPDKFGDRGEGEIAMEYRRSMGAQGTGDDAVRFVSIDPRCCCGGHGKSACARSRFAFTVTAWSMSLGKAGPMAWDKVAVLDSDELWALPGYDGLPHAYPECPVVSPDNPDVVCFRVRQRLVPGGRLELLKSWMIEVDMRRKVLLSVRCDDHPLFTAYQRVPVTLQ